MIPAELAAEICRHLIEKGYDLINMPEPPENVRAGAAFVVQKNRTRHLLLVAIVDGKHPYDTTATEQVKQYHLQKRQFAAHTAIITVTGDPWEITYPDSI